MDRVLKAWTDSLPKMLNTHTHTQTAIVVIAINAWQVVVIQ